jgi:hypothetical protein
LPAANQIARRPDAVERRRYRTDPDWYEYALTDSGRELYGSILALLRWAEVHLPPGGGDDPELRLRHRSCGRLTHAKVVRACCGEELDPRDVDAELIERRS